MARGPHRDALSDAHRSCQDLPGVASKVVARPEHELHGESKRLGRRAPIDVNRLEILDERRAVVPGRPVAWRGDVVAVERAQGNRLQRRSVEAVREFLANAIEHAPIEIDQVHLVDRDDEAGDPEEPGDLRVTPGLRSETVPRVDEQDGEVRRRRPGRHVPGVLFVARRIGQNEFAARGREIPVRDVNRDALFAFRLEAVREQRKIDRAGGPVPRRARDRPHLVLVHRLRVVQEPADQRALPIVDAAGRAQAQERGHQKYPSRFLSSIEPS